MSVFGEFNLHVDKYTNKKAVRERLKMHAGKFSYIHTVSVLLYESQHQTPECCLLAHG